jgi:hypothetical protein
MNQAVITFTNSTARASAITSPVEGMVTYLADTDTYQFWNGSAWTALVPASSAGSGNAIINGAFEINQRNFTTATANGYGFDRWTTFRSGGTVTASSQTFTLGAAPIAGFEARNFQRIVTSGQSGSADYSVLIQPIESVRSFAGQTVTVSFYAKAGAGTPKIGVEFNQSFGTGGSPSADVSVPAGALTLNTTWTRYTATIAIPSIAGKTLGTNGNDNLGLALWTSAGSTLNSRASSIGIQNETIDIWGVQLEAGSTATAFRRNANSLQGELAACQRYYFRTNALRESTFGTYAYGFAYSSTATTLLSYLPVAMRTKPTSVEFSSAARVASGSGEFTFSGLTIDTNASTSTVAVVGTTGSSGLTTNHPYWLRGQSDATSFIAFSAEL